MATKKRSKKKNSLVENINRRKRSGKSRPKSRSTVSRQAYEEMQRGWPKKSSKRKGKSASKSPAKTTGSRKKSKR